MKFTDIFIKRPVLASVISLLIFIVGLRAYSQLQIREYPKTTNAQVTVTTTYTGAAPSLIAGFITTPLEKAISQVDGIDYLESTSIQGTSQITANLALNYDPYKALTQIQAQVQQVINQLPPEAQRPQLNVQVGQTTDAMYMSFFSKDYKSNQITDYLNRVVVPKLSSVAGVQQAELLGQRTFAMRIWLNPQKMAALNISPTQVRHALAANNYLAAVGQTKGHLITINLNADTQMHSAQQFKHLIVAHRNGSIIRLGDISTVDLGAESYSKNVHFNGQSATFVGIKVAPTANPLTVAKNVHKVFPQIQANLPQGMHGVIAYDSTQYINDSIHDVASTLIETMLIVVVVIFLFLGSLRSLLIPAVTIPLALVGAGLIMEMLGFSVNLLTLLAMVLAISLVVDDAIVVVENIHRHIEEGQPPMQAALRGARELGAPIIAMTITLVAVYAPIGLMGGLTGTLFTQFAFSLAGAVVISGITALTLSPMMCSRLLKPDTGKKGFAHFIDVAFDKLKNAYERRVHATLNYRPVVLVFGLAILVSCFFLFQSAKKELAPTEDQGLILVQATGAASSNIEQTTHWSSELTKIFQSYPATAQIFLINGVGGGGSAALTNSTIAGLVMKPWSQRKISQMALMPKVQAAIKNIPGVRAAAFAKPSLPGNNSGFPVQFVVQTTNSFEQLNQVTQRLLSKARSSGLFAYTDTDLKYDLPQYQLHIDRNKLADLGLTVQDLGADLATMLSGGYVNYFSIQDRSYQVIPQVKRPDRLNPSQIENYHIQTGSGQMVPLSTVASLKREVIPEQLKHFQQLNAATIQAVPAPGVTMGQALSYLQSTAHQIFPPGYSMDYAGQSRQFEKEGNALLVTFFLAIIVIFLVLAAQFESYRDPTVILVSVPMAISGALIFLTLGFATVNIYTEVGLVTLIGLISKHGILITQFANQLQLEGLSKRRAIEEAAGIRLRPVLMTTCAMVAGMVPLLTATGPGAVSRFDMGLVVATGMGIGTLFTLFVLPSMYMLLAKDHHGSGDSYDGGDAAGRPANGLQQETPGPSSS